jgi:hypothetical protein
MINKYFDQDMFSNILLRAVQQLENMLDVFRYHSRYAFVTMNVNDYRKHVTINLVEHYISKQRKHDIFNTE